MLFVILFYDLFRLFDIVFQQTYFPVFCQHLRSTELHTVHINPDRTLYTSSSGLLHTPPVLKRITDQSIGRNGGNGIVPVTYLYGIQGYFNHRSVGSILRHLNPVSHLQHIVGRKLNTRNEAHNTVFEHQHQDSGRSSQTGKQHHRRFINQNTDDNNTTNKEKNDLNRL